MFRKTFLSCMVLSLMIFKTMPMTIQNDDITYTWTTEDWHEDSTDMTIAGEPTELESTITYPTTEDWHEDSTAYGTTGDWHETSTAYETTEDWHEDSTAGQTSQTVETTEYLPETTSYDCFKEVFLDEQILTGYYGYSFDTYRIDLRYHNIIGIDSEAFSKFYKLQRLDLSHNRLTSLPAYPFKNLSGLKELRLNHNELKSLDKTTLYGLSSLSQLTLNHNELTRFERKTFIKSSNLNYLDLSYNKLGAIWSWTLEGLGSKLTRLGLEGNRISAMTTSSFNLLKNLRNICFASNEMSSFEMSKLHAIMCRRRKHCSVLLDTCCNESGCIVPFPTHKLHTN